MLKKETLQRIAVLSKVKVEDLEAAIKDDKEVDLVIDEKLTPYTEDELNTLKANEYKSGKEKGVEMAIKDAKDKNGLDFQGKTLDGLLDAHKAKVIKDAKIEPDKKVSDLEQKVTTLQATVQDYENKVAEKDAEVNTIRTNSELYKHIPQPGEDGPALGADEVIQLMKANGYEFKQEGGVVSASKSGKPILDKLSNPSPIKDVIEGFLKEKKLIGESTTIEGRGGKDKKPVIKVGKLSELKQKFISEGKNVQGEEFAKAVEAAAKDPEFDMAN